MSVRSCHTQFVSMIAYIITLNLDEAVSIELRHRIHGFVRGEILIVLVDPSFVRVVREWRVAAANVRNANVIELVVGE